MSGPVFFNPQTGQVNSQPQPVAAGPYARATHIEIKAPPPQQQQQPQQQQHQQQQQQSATSSIFADSPLSQYVDSPLGVMATTYGQQLMGNNRFIKGSLQGYDSFRQLKYYFNVNTGYVTNKLRLVLFPFPHKGWKRRVHRQADGERYLAPRDDINAPDLYIPAMAFVSYVLVIAFLMGEPWHFSPDVVADQFSRSLMALLFEVAFVKAGFYFLSSASVPLLDIVAYCGYKYVGISLAVVVGFVVGSKLAYLASLLLAAASMAVFIVKSFRLAAPPLGELAGAPSPAAAAASSNTRNYFLLACGVLQMVLFYILGHFAETETVATESTSL
jgi:hypothetical protein